MTTGKLRTFILALLCATGSRHNRGGRSSVRGVSGHGAFKLLSLKLRVDPQALQCLCGQVPLQYGCLLVTIIQTESNVPVGGSPRGTQIHQTQLVRIGGVALVL